jgi:hypothetical protein
MFQGPQRPLSGAYNSINSLWFYRWSVGGSSVLLSLPLTTERQQAEWNTIKIMAQNNNFTVNFLIHLKVEMKQQAV